MPALVVEVEAVEGGLARRAALTFVSGLLQNGARLLVGFVVTPVVVRGLGAELYGAWVMIQQTVGYLALSDLRPMGTLKFTLAVRQHVRNNAEKRRQVGASLLLWAASIPVFILAGVACAFWLPSLIRTAPEHAVVVRTAFLLVLFAVVMDRLTSLPENVLRGENLAYKAMGLGAVTVAAGGLLSALAIWGGYGMVGVAVATLLSGVPGSLTRLWVARRQVSWFGAALPLRREFLEFARVSGWLFLSGLSGLLMFSSDILLVGLMFTPSAAAIYATTGAVLRLASEPIGQLLSSGNAGIAGLCGRREWGRVGALRAEMHLLALALVTVVGAGVLALNRDFLMVWVGEGFYAGDAINLLLAAIAAARILIRVDGVIVDCLLDFRAKAWTMGACGLGGVAAAFALSPLLGVAGIALGTLLGHAALSAYFPFLLRRRMGLPLGEHLATLRRPAAVSCAVLLVAWTVSRWGTPGGWGGLVAWGSMLGAGAALTMWYAGLPGGMRERGLGRLRSALRSKSKQAT
jgi:O-antigen/teichoic acid export membrane protein